MEMTYKGPRTVHGERQHVFVSDEGHMIIGSKYGPETGWTVSVYFRSPDGKRLCGMSRKSPGIVSGGRGVKERIVTAAIGQIRFGEPHDVDACDVCTPNRAKVG